MDQYTEKSFYRVLLEKFYKSLKIIYSSCCSKFSKFSEGTEAAVSVEKIEPAEILKKIMLKEVLLNYTAEVCTCAFLQVRTVKIPVKQQYTRGTSLGISSIFKSNCTSMFLCSCTMFLLLETIRCICIGSVFTCVEHGDENICLKQGR